uniref:Phosphatidic acid phosphatase type 2/haloperoxidase domain-containing protein n=2 Tax=Arion vulgaris TaxID=1028688 RepID=A0A0B6ZTG8_9EUPU
MPVGQKIQILQLRPDLFPEVLLRIAVIIAFIITDDAVPFKRIIHQEEAWLYTHPHKKDIVPAYTLHFINLVISLFLVWAIYKYKRNIMDAISALLGVTLSIFLALTITNFIKLSVGRPRPDFFARCFKNPPKDAYNLSLAVCDMPEDMINQGYKSFPSGHSAMAFGCMAYLSFYIAWSLRVFQPKVLYPSLRLLAFLAPLVCATLIAISRTVDYHHHWQDILVGSLIGTTISYLCFRQSFPGLLEKKLLRCHPSSPQPEPSFIGAENY